MGDKLLGVVVFGGKGSVMVGAPKSGRRIIIKDIVPEMKPFPKYVIVEITGKMGRMESAQPIEWFTDLGKAVERCKEIGASVEIEPEGG